VIRLVVMERKEKSKVRKLVFSIVLTALIVCVAGGVVLAQDFVHWRMYAGKLDRYTAGGFKVGTWGSGFNDVYDIKFDSAGNLWLPDYGAGALVKVDSTGTVMGSYTGYGGPIGLTVGDDGKIYTCGADGYVYQYGSDGGMITPLYNSGGTCFGMATDSSGNIYLSMNGGQVIKLTKASGFTTAAWTTASLGVYGRGMAFGPDGMLYVCMGGSNAIMKLDPATGSATTFTVDAPQFPDDVDFLNNGNMIVSCWNSNSIELYNGPTNSDPGKRIKTLVANVAYPQYLAVMSVSSPNAGIEASVSLSGFTGDLSLCPVKIDVLQGTTQVSTQTINMGTTNKATFDNVPPGTYTVRAKGNVFLAKSVTVSINPGDLGKVTLALPGGDLDGNGTIDLNDFSIVDTNFGQSNQ